MRFGESGQMWRIDDQLTALFDNRAELVTRLSANPQLIVVRIEQRNDSLVLPSRVTNVNLSTNFSGAPERFTNIPCEKRVRYKLIIYARDDRVQRNNARVDQVCRGFDQVARGRLDLSDDV